MTATRVTHHRVFFYNLYQRPREENKEACGAKILGVLSCRQGVRILVRLRARFMFTLKTFAWLVTNCFIEHVFRLCEEYKFKCEKCNLQDKQ